VIFRSLYLFLLPVAMLSLGVSAGGAQPAPSQAGAEKPGLIRVVSPQMAIAWDEQGKLAELSVRGRPVSLPNRNLYYLNGKITNRAQTRAEGETVVQEADFPDGKLQLVWRGGDRILVTVRAEVAAGQVKEAGFSLDLPAGDITTATTVRWAAMKTVATAANDHAKALDIDEIDQGYRREAQIAADASSVVPFDTNLFSWSATFLLESPTLCLHIGRQVHLRRDYTTGYLERTESGWNLVWKWQPQRPFPARFESQPLMLASFENHADAMADHRRWIAKEFKLVPKERNPKVPDWFHKTRLVFQVNVGETNGAVVHDYKDMTNMFDALHAVGVPEETLFYIPDYNPMTWVSRGWCGPVCCLWPENPLLGGESAFREMMARAEKYRYHVMPHSSIMLMWGEYIMPFTGEDGQPMRWVNPEWEKLKQWGVPLADGTFFHWPTEGPNAHYPYAIHYLDENVPEVRKYFIDGQCELIEKYGVDAICFDSIGANRQMLSKFNTPSMATRFHCDQKIIDELYRRHPNVLLGSEIVTDDSVWLVPLTNSRSRFQYEVMGDYIYTFARVNDPGSLPQRYPQAGISRFNPKADEYERALTKAQPNNIPRILINYRDLGLDEQTRKLIREMLALTAR